ncbi:type II toxin-antitoxin system HicB family antitoxin [Enterocloster lavalensis]|jgi:predicted RNase H-like HicB family nuclease|uniref:type II toxin-antitoxin system HicB family antitoxin n=1 Tax=Enterocloster lavalensis TaxID=460384 RepID=UPI0034A3370A
MADYKYQMIITWSDIDGAYIVDVPELPGCMADGKTIAEAVENAKVIIAEWIEYAKEDGIPIPEPKSVKTA